MAHNRAIYLYRDEPTFNQEISAQDGFPWRCDIWERAGDWPLFATAWGKTRTEAMSKANSIVQACSVANWAECGPMYDGPDRRRSVSLPPACADLWVTQMTAMLAVVRAARSLKLIGYSPTGYPMVGPLALLSLTTALDKLDPPIARDTP